MKSIESDPQVHLTGFFKISEGDSLRRVRKAADLRNLVTIAIIGSAGADYLDSKIPPKQEVLQITGTVSLIEELFKRVEEAKQ